MKIVNATPKKMLEIFWNHNPKVVHGTLLDFISNNASGWICNGIHYSVSQVILLDENQSHYAEYFSLEQEFTGDIKIQGEFGIHDYIDCGVREFVSKIFHKVGGILLPEEVEANREGSMWRSRFMAGTSACLVVEGDAKAVFVKLEPCS